MRSRLCVLRNRAIHLFLGALAVAVVVGGVAAALGAGAGKHGGHEVVTVVIAVGAVGALGIGIAAVLDPMGLTAYPSLGHVGTPLLGTGSHGGEAFERLDDVLYAGGVVLIGLAVLLAFICTWAGVPPANPFA